TLLRTNCILEISDGERYIKVNGKRIEVGVVGEHTKDFGHHCSKERTFEKTLSIFRPTSSWSSSEWRHIIVPVFGVIAVSGSSTSDSPDLPPIAAAASASAEATAAPVTTAVTAVTAALPPQLPALIRAALPPLAAVPTAEAPAHRFRAKCPHRRTECYRRCCPGATAITATTSSAPANEDTFATVARRAHNRRKLVPPPPPPPPKPQPPLTRQQYDAKVHTARARSANKMVKPLLPPKKFAVVRVALHSNRQLRACQGRDRAGLLNALCTELGIRKYVALVSTIGNSILEVYCMRDVLHAVVSTLINREQKVLPSSFNPLAIGHDGQPLTDEGSKQVARRLAHLCNRASTVNLRDAILMGASERVKELTREFFDKIKRSPNATIDGRSRINVARQAHASNVDQWLNEARASFEREQQADAEFMQQMEHHEEEDAAAEAPLDRAMEEVISSESGPSTEGAARLDN
ncbi:hypothetical protein HDU83_009081, partial [Entophlyctis luteolus]